MSRNNGARFLNRLLPATPDTYQLCIEVERRFLDVCESYMRIRGVQIPLPADLSADMYRWRQMAVRFKQGDHRHTEAELKSLRAIAQWTLDVNCDLRNQPHKKIEWKD